MDYILDTDLLMQLITKVKIAKDNYGQAKYISEQIVTDLNLYPLSFEGNIIQSNRVLSNMETIKKSITAAIQQLDFMVSLLEHYVLRIESQQYEMIQKIQKTVDEMDLHLDNIKSMLTNGIFVDAYPQKSVYTFLNMDEKTITAIGASRDELLSFQIADD